MTLQWLRVGLLCAVLCSVTVGVRADTTAATAGTAKPDSAIASVPSPPKPDAKVYEDTFKALFLLFVLAVILESALAVIFNWRPFVETLNARAVRPLVAFLAAYVLVSKFALDLVTTIANSADPKEPHPVSGVGKLVTALVLAGGSAGINNILIALGYRQRRTPETATPKPQPNQCWVAVRLTRKQANGPVQVFIGTRLAAGGSPPLVGIISGTSMRGLRYFLSDPGRFPGYGGYGVPANSEVTVEVAGVDGNGAALQRKSWGPYVVAGGSIIDVDLEL